jgi:tripartite-type tricarboxylate transporter receptor subunit TctC
MMRMLFLLFVSALSLLVVNAQATDYPAAPVKLIAPFAPGGSIDTVARVLSTQLSQELGQPVVVENRSGAAGNVGFEAVARSAPDGYTLAVAGTTLAVNVSLYKNLRYNALTDLAPITQLVAQPNVLVVPRELPVKNVEELIAYAKANPGKLNYGSSGAGASQHLAGELFKRHAGIDIVHVPYRSGGPAMTDVVAGRLQLMFETIPGSLPFVRSGQVRALAVTGEQRSPALPDVPTVREAGVDKFVAVGWLGIVAPANTPAPIVEKLNAAIRKAVGTPLVSQRLTELGLEVKLSTPNEFSDLINREVEAFRKLITDAKISLD